MFDEATSGIPYGRMQGGGCEERRATESRLQPLKYLKLNFIEHLIDRMRMP